MNPWISRIQKQESQAQFYENSKEGWYLSLSFPASTCLLAGITGMDNTPMQLNEGFSVFCLSAETDPRALHMQRENLQSLPDRSGRSCCRAKTASHLSASFLLLGKAGAHYHTQLSFGNLNYLRLCMPTDKNRHLPPKVNFEGNTHANYIFF